jgi:hypothetical protein
METLSSRGLLQSLKVIFLKPSLDEKIGKNKKEGKLKEKSKE